MGPRRILAALLGTLAAAALLAAVGCGSMRSGRAYPEAHSGQLDLGDWDFGIDGPTILHGDWDLYWDRLLTPAQLDSGAHDPDGTLRVPGLWTGQALGDGEIPTQGAATIRLKVVMPDDAEPMALRLGAIGSAYELWVNGQRVTGAGTVGPARESTVPQWRSHVVDVPEHSSVLDIVLTISSFHHRKAGPFEVIRLGREDDLRSARERKVAVELFLAGAILLMGIYHLGLFASRREERAPLYFGLFCLLLSVYVLLEGERYLCDLTSWSTWAVQRKISNLASFFAVPVFIAFIRTLFPDEVPRWVARTLSAAIVLLALAVLVTPALVYSRLIPVYEILVLITCAVLLLSLTRAVFKGRRGARTFAVGFAVLSLAVLNDVLFDLGLIPTAKSLGVGLFCFVISQSFVLSRRFASAFQTIDEQRQALLRSNRAHADEIEERKEAQHALRESEFRYRSLVENVPDLIYTLDPRGRFLAVNEFALDLLGYEKDELVGHPFEKVVHPDDLRRTRELFQETASGKGDKHRDLRFRLVNRASDTVWVALNASATFDDDGTFVQEHGVARDISEEKQLEARLLQAQRMEAIGSLAGGMAHDFNNLLMGIQGSVSLLMLSTEPDQPGHDKLRNIATYVSDGASLTQQLLGLAEGGKYDVQPTDLNEIVAKTARIFGTTHKQVRIHESLDDDLWAVEVDRGQMEQVLLNLLVNAQQAMTDGGEIHLESKNVRLAERDSLLFQMEPGRYVKIAVTDNGIGMDEETRRRCFDPFFTTKDKGRGTGLGLASVYGIVRNHGGFVHVYSELGEGTSFKLFFPSTEKSIIPVQHTAETFALGEETILLVDDEPMVLQVTAEMLRAMGYHVHIADSGPAAIEVYDSLGPSIDLVILDLVMPDMSGGDTFDHLKAMDGDVKVLLSSGYSIDGEAKAILDRGCVGFIQKPFRLEVLSQRIRGVL